MQAEVGQLCSKTNIQFITILPWIQVHEGCSSFCRPRKQKEKRKLTDSIMHKTTDSLATAAVWMMRTSPAETMSMVLSIQWVVDVSKSKSPACPAIRSKWK
jgi:hypothetical protein